MNAVVPAPRRRWLKRGLLVVIAAWLVLLAMALGPQLLGHTAYNWSLRYVSATFVAVVTLGEPVGSALLAFIVFGEGFAPLQFFGFSLLLVGIYLAAKGEKGTGNAS